MFKVVEASGVEPASLVDKPAAIRCLATREFSCTGSPPPSLHFSTPSRPPHLCGRSGSTARVTRSLRMPSRARLAVIGMTRLGRNHFEFELGPVPFALEQFYMPKCFRLAFKLFPDFLFNFRVTATTEDYFPNSCPIDV
jgi:hypothetical protein